MESNHQFTRPGQVRADLPAPDACMQCGESLAMHALRALQEALDIPHPATTGDGEVRDKILAERVLHAVVFLSGILGPDRGSPREWALDYFRDRLAEHPATGYRTWDESVAESKALRAAGGAR
jgi:hypothetical protein